MKRLFNLRTRRILGTAAILTTVTLTATDGLAATLRHHVVIRDDVVRLGDIFKGAEKYADRVVLQSPAPGKKLILNVQWLFRVARNYRVDWKPLTKLDQVVLERSTVSIATEQIRNTIAGEIRRQLGQDGRFEIELDNQLLNMQLPGEEMPTVRIQRLQLDQQIRRFAATLVGGEGRTRGSRLNATGRFHRIIDVPVLVRRMRSDEVIGPSDVRMISVRADRIDMNALQDVEDLIGMSPLRSLSAQRPIKKNDIRLPILVPKGSIVMMVFQTDRMILTAQGRALQNGSKGDVIRILNAKTHKTIDGVVVNSGTVTVKPLGRVALR